MSVVSSSDEEIQVIHMDSKSKRKSTKGKEKASRARQDSMSDMSGTTETMEEEESAPETGPSVRPRRMTHQAYPRILENLPLTTWVEFDKFRAKKKAALASDAGHRSSSSSQKGQHRSSVV